MQEITQLLGRIQSLLRWMYTDMTFTEEDFLKARDVAEQLDGEIDNATQEEDE